MLHGHRFKFPGFVTSEHVGFALGVGRRALDEITEIGRTKNRGTPPSPLRERSSFQEFIGECDFKLRAARAFAFEIHEQAWETVCSGESLNLSTQLEMRGSATYATRVALDVVTQAFQYAGASALYSTNVLQRYYRDLSAAAQHNMVNTTAYEIHGQVALGLSEINPLG